MRRFALFTLIVSLAGLAKAADAPLKCPLNAAYDQANPFAQYIRGETKHGVIIADKLAMAFVPIDWDNPGHVLVIPRRPVLNLHELRDADLLAVFHLIDRIAVAQQRAFGATGYSIEQNNGRNQGVCHAHFHVIPNTPVQKVSHATDQMRDDVAAKLRAALPPAG